MSILPLVDTSALPEEYRKLVARGTGTQRTIMHSLEGGRAYIAFGNWIRFRSRLDPRLREMIILQVGYVLRNEYEVAHHIKLGPTFGVRDEDFRAIIDETRGRDGKLPTNEATALRAAREMVLERRLTPATSAALVEHFDPELVVEIALIAGFYSFADMFLGAMAIDCEDEYRPYLATMPFEAA